MSVIQMSALPKQDINNIIELKVIDGKISKKEKVRYNKDGSVDKRHTNKVKGVSSEVYPFTEEEVKMMIDILDKHIESADGNIKKQIAYRNKMLFIIGINVGLRASDLCGLTYSFFMEDNSTFKNTDKEPLKLKPKKTEKTNKFVPVFINNNVKKVITDYIEKYPIEDMNDYLFKSRQGNKSITEAMLWKILNDTAIEAKIKKNIGSHSLRKTFGSFIWHRAENKSEALVNLQVIFNHSSPSVTAKYIGITNNEIANMFYSLDSN